MRGGFNVIDLSGQEINGLSIIDRAGSKNKLATWNCICSCGKRFIAIGSDIRQGKTKTCGCRISIKNRRNWQGYKEIHKSYWSSITLNAEQRNLEYSITIEYAWDIYILQNKKCALSGIDIDFNEGRYPSASLDRIDSHQGYVPNNIQWVHKLVNKLKGSFSDQELIQWAKRISDYAKTSNRRTALTI